LTDTIDYRTIGFLHYRPNPITNTVQDQSINQSTNQWFISDNKAHNHTQTVINS